MLYVMHDGHSKPLDLSRWRVLSCRQWQEDPEKPDTIRPQLVLFRGYFFGKGLVDKSPIPINVSD
jgi:hypothetical protein